MITYYKFCIAILHLGLDTLRASKLGICWHEIALGCTAELNIVG